MEKYIMEKSKKYLQATFAFMLIVTSLNFHADEDTPTVEKEKPEKTAEAKKDKKNGKKEYFNVGVSLFNNNKSIFIQGRNRHK